MSEKQSNAAKERAAAQKAVQAGDLKDRETYTAKQVATRLGTDAKTMRKFFRSSHSTVEAVGQGGRYEFAATDLPKIKREFEGWRKKAAERTKPPSKPVTDVHTEAELAEATEQAAAGMADAIQEAVDKGLEDDDPDMDPDYINSQTHNDEPSEEELAELEDTDLDLDDLDEDD
ncbi:MAG TPA: hypothetical protein VGP24_09290 [Glaciihabitans sp.]|nr:hypothetical protein [Glaciihabitans sp.]